MMVQNPFPYIFPTGFYTADRAVVNLTKCGHYKLKCAKMRLAVESRPDLLRELEWFQDLLAVRRAWLENLGF